MAASQGLALALLPDRRPVLSPEQGTWPLAEVRCACYIVVPLQRTAKADAVAVTRRLVVVKGPTAAAMRADNVVLRSAAGDCHLPERRQAPTVW